MSWADLKRKYAAGECAASQSTEDMAARRILRALGLTEKTLWRREREAGIANDGRDTLLERARAVALELPEPIILPPVRDVKSVKEAERILFDLGETLTFGSSRGFCALVYRIKGGSSLRAIVSKGEADLLYVEELPTPCTIRKAADGKTVLLDCDAGTYYDTILKTKGTE